MRVGRMRMGCTTWQETYGSGASTGIRGLRARTVCFAAAVGPTSPTAAGLPFPATPTTRTTPPTAWASGLACPQVSSDLKQVCSGVPCPRDAGRGPDWKERSNGHKAGKGEQRNRGLGMYPHRLLKCKWPSIQSRRVKSASYSQAESTYFPAPHRLLGALTCGARAAPVHTPLTPPRHAPMLPAWKSRR